MLKKVSTRKITLRKEIYQYLLYEAFTEEPQVADTNISTSDGTP